MCGIAGILNYNDAVRRKHVRQVLDVLYHRGPDDSGIYLNHSGNRENRTKHDYPFVGLGHRRLSIIDLSRGRQPITNEDKTIWIVFNGEIYNYQELKSELIRDGHRFYTNTDTEVIIHLYEKYGQKCTRYLRGMFAFAIWDDVKKCLMLARDRIGKKPIYYYWDDCIFVFGSELKSILAYAPQKSQIDIVGLSHYIQFGYIPDPYTILGHVKKLPPAHSLILKDRQLHSEKYWQIDLQVNERPPGKGYVSEIEDKLKECVKIRLMSDVPLGAFLSGGIDSSLIVAMMAEMSGKKIQTFSIGFQDQKFNELPYAKLVSRKYKTDHYEMVVTPESFELLERIIAHFDEPFSDPSSIPTYFVSQLASQSVKVVLTGDGGDELFGGYDTYDVCLNRNMFDVIPSLLKNPVIHRLRKIKRNIKGKNFLQNALLGLEERFIDYTSHVTYYRYSEIFTPEIKTALGSYQARQDEIFKSLSNLSQLARLQHIDMETYLPGDILVKMDRMSMAHSIEARVPLLDQQLIEMVNAMPADFKIQHRKRKMVLKKIAQKYLPLEILQRSKKGFAVPLNN